jgi:hypothetical protein
MNKDACHSCIIAKLTNCLEQFGTKLEKEIKDKILLTHWRAQSQLAKEECSLVGV